MKIPTEPVPLARSTASRANERRKTQPVCDASGTGYEMSHPAPNETRNEPAGAPDRRQTMRGGNAPAGQESAYPGGERRTEERRRANKPVLLDTRMRQMRRRKAEAAKISLKI